MTVGKEYLDHQTRNTFLEQHPDSTMSSMAASGEHEQLLMSALNVFYRDFTHLTGVLLRAAFYLTPIIYPPDILGERVAALLKLNPVYYPVLLARSVLYYGEIGNMETWLTGFGAATAVLLLGLLVFTSTQEKFVYYA